MCGRTQLSRVPHICQKAPLKRGLKYIMAVDACQHPFSEKFDKHEIGQSVFRNKQGGIEGPAGELIM